MSTYSHSLQRSLTLCATPDTVFRYFTDSERFAQWFGKGSTVDAKVGGDVVIVHPGDVVVRGAVQQIEPGQTLSFTYGYEDPAKQIPVGSTCITITVQAHEEGTELSLRHELNDEKARDEHDPGWRFQLSPLANLATKEQHQHANALVDQWFEAWFETNGDARQKLLEQCATEDVRMQDQYASLQGREQLHHHIMMCQKHMSNGSMKRTGNVKQCQGTGLVEWQATDAEGTATGGGSNVVRFAADGRIRSVVGFW